MEKVEANINEQMETSSFVDSLSYLTENSSALGIRSLALEEYCNYAQYIMKILETKIHLLSDANNNTVKNRNELLSRNRTNEISLEGLFNVQFEFYNYVCDAKDDFIRTEEALKVKRTQYDKIINSYKMKWEAVELEYGKLPMASELSAVEKENTALNAEAKRLENLFTKTKADYTEKYNEWWCNLLAKILDFAVQYQTHTKFVKVTNEIWRDLRGKPKCMILVFVKNLLNNEGNNQTDFVIQSLQKNTKLQELVQKLHSCGESQVIRQYSGYFKPIPLVTSIPEHGKATDTSKFSFDLTLFDEISIPQDNLEIETEDESLFNLYQNGRNFEMTHNSNVVFSCENTDPKKQPVENAHPVTTGDEYCSENQDDNEVTEHDIRSNGNNSKDEIEVFDGDMSHPGSDPDVANVNDIRFQLNNQHVTNDVEDAAQIYFPSSKGRSGAKFDTVAVKKETTGFKLKKKKQIHKRAEGEDKENGRNAPKKGKYSLKSKNAEDSSKIGSAERFLSDNHMFDFDFKENFNQEEDKENERSQFSFFLKPESGLSESTSIFKLF